MATSNRLLKDLKARDKAKLKGKCGAVKKDGTMCTQRAGFGTTHPGTGNCRWHGGALKTHRQAAIRQEAIKFMGAPLDINPLEAIVWCIRITAGEVQWLSMKIAEADEVDWIENTIAGKQLNVFQRTRADAQDRLVRYSKEAIQLGLAERAIRMAENFGLALARLLEGIEADMGFNATQRKLWQQSVRKHLILLQGGSAANLAPFDEDPDIIEGQLVSATG
ncbi:MAG TPA: hypothetical protein VJT32_04150 [bacterium]|nr:hypothetical protein [bacterium]